VWGVRKRFLGGGDILGRKTRIKKIEPSCLQSPYMNGNIKMNFLSSSVIFIFLWYVSKKSALVSRQFTFTTFHNAVLQPGAMSLIFGLNLHPVLQMRLPNTSFCSPATTADRSVPRMRKGAPSTGQASPSAGHVSHACLCKSWKSNEINSVLLFL